MNEIKIDDLRIEDWNWLLGLYLADGSKWKERQRQYRIYFYLSPKKDKAILVKLSKILKTLRIKFDVRHVKKINTIFVRLCNKQFFELMPSKTSEFEPENAQALIAGFLDGDGYISKKEGCIGFSQTIVKWIGPFISNYLKTFGITPWREKYYRNAFYYRASLKKVKERTNIIKLMAKAGVV